MWELIIQKDFQIRIYFIVTDGGALISMQCLEVWKYLKDCVHEI